MKSPEQLKGLVRNLSKKYNANPNSVLQMCLFEGILEKLSKSKYRYNFILKGGLLISSLIGVQMRSTMDMDTTIKGVPVNEDNIKNIINEILNIEIGVNIDYKLLKLKRIRTDDVYEDFSASILCTYGNIKTILSIDITTGDIISPREINYCYSKLLETGKIPIMTYSLENIIAEKFETISSRNLTTTRARDFYDLYMLFNLYYEKINKQELKESILKTSRYRGSLLPVDQYKEISKLLRNSDNIKIMWNNYIGKNPYARNVSLSDTIDVYEKICSILKN